MAELHRARLPAVLAADPDLQIVPPAAPHAQRHLHQVAHPPRRPPPPPPPPPFRSRRVPPPSFPAISISLPTPVWSRHWNGSSPSSPGSTENGRNRPRAARANTPT